LCEHSGELFIAIGALILISLIVYGAFMVHTLVGIGIIGIFFLIIGGNLVDD
jgi:hypothetical protein